MVVAKVFNASTQVEVQGQFGLQTELQEGQGYTEKPCLR